MKNTLLLYVKFQYTTYRLLSENQNLLFLDVILSNSNCFFIFLHIFSALLFKVNFFNKSKEIRITDFFEEKEWSELNVRDMGLRNCLLNDNGYSQPYCWLLHEIFHEIFRKTFDYVVTFPFLTKNVSKTTKVLKGKVINTSGENKRLKGN